MGFRLSQALYGCIHLKQFGQGVQISAPNRDRGMCTLDTASSAVSNNLKVFSVSSLTTPKSIHVSIALSAAVLSTGPTRRISSSRVQTSAYRIYTNIF
jgi:hypothetical protein